MMSIFLFEHAGTTGLFTWMKYKAKESFLLSRIVGSLLRATAPHLAVHNSVFAKKHITDGFLTERAGEYFGKDIVLVDPTRQSGSSIFFEISLTFVLFLIPILWMRLVIVAMLRKKSGSVSSVLVFCDAHLSGFVLCLALKELGVATATLQHGLYRSDDKGSVMALHNFVADKIFLWDEKTRKEFIKFGVDPHRIEITGSYGFGILASRRHTPVQENLIFLCPSYDHRSLEDFLKIHESIPSTFVVKYSLHPILRAIFPHLKAEPLNKAAPRPVVAVCGDGAVIMDSLACGIPVVTIGERKMASVHFRLDQFNPSANDWMELIKRAKLSIEEDRGQFGFSLTMGQGACSKG